LGLSQINREEKQMYALKYKSTPFGALSETQRLAHSDGLLVKINAITGWVIPGGTLTDVLVDQFNKKFFESYPTVNPDEIEYAFRSSGTTIKDWGREMNLSLIDQVMIPYMEKRFELSKIEDQEKTKLMLQSAPIETTDEDFIYLWNSTAALVIKGFYPVDLIPSKPSLYDWMEKNGNLDVSKNDKVKFWERACLTRHGMLAKAYEQNPHSLETKRELNEFYKMREDKIYSESEHAYLTTLAKKMVIYEMMKQGKSL
jgi:hypothetical protein